MPNEKESPAFRCPYCQTSIEAHRMNGCLERWLLAGIQKHCGAWGSAVPPAEYRRDVMAIALLQQVAALSPIANLPGEEFSPIAAIHLLNDPREVRWEVSIPITVNFPFRLTRSYLCADAILRACIIAFALLDQQRPAPPPIREGLDPIDARFHPNRGETE